MPGFRYTSDRDDEAGFLFSSELPAGSRLAMLPFFPQAFKIKRSLDANINANRGLLSYALHANLVAKTFTVASAWVDEAAFNAWVSTPEHVTAMRKLGPRVTGGTLNTEARDPAAATD